MTEDLLDKLLHKEFEGPSPSVEAESEFGPLFERELKFSLPIQCGPEMTPKFQDILEEKLVENVFYVEFDLNLDDPEQDHLKVIDQTMVESAFHFHLNVSALS